MNLKLSWNNILELIVGGLLLSVIISGPGLIYDVAIGKASISIWRWIGPVLFFAFLLLAIAWKKIRSIFETLGQHVLLIVKWIVNNWQFSLGLLLFFGFGVVVYFGYYNREYILLAYILAIGVWLLAKYTPSSLDKMIYKTPKGGPITIYSGTAGKFSYSPNGPWQPPVECKPTYPNWEKIEGAKWVWIKEKPTDEEARAGQTVWHNLSFNLNIKTKPNKAELKLAVDDLVEISINGLILTTVSLEQKVKQMDISDRIGLGINKILMKIVNRKGIIPNETSLTNPTGIIYRLDIT
jgi:hypothetical protein